MERVNQNEEKLYHLLITTKRLSVMKKVLVKIIENKSDIFFLRKKNTFFRKIESAVDFQLNLKLNVFV